MVCDSGSEAEAVAMCACSLRPNRLEDWDWPENQDEVNTAKQETTLNLEWMEWLMGYPPGWTYLSPKELEEEPKNITTS